MAQDDRSNRAILDHVESIVKAPAAVAIGMFWVFNEINNIKIVKMICEKMDKLVPRSGNKKYDKLITFVKDRPGHDFRYAIDASKIQNELGWQPKESFMTGIDKTINWYLENESWWKDILDNTYKQERLGVVSE